MECTCSHFYSGWCALHSPTIVPVVRKPDQLMTLKEVAIYLNCEERSIYRLIAKDKTFPAIKVAGQWRWEAAALIAWTYKGHAT